MKKFLTLLLLFIVLVAQAQNADRKFVSLQDFGNYINITVSDGYYIIKPYTEDIIETSFIPKGETFKPHSHAVVLLPQNINIKLKDKKNSISYTTKGIEVKVQKAPFKISYSYKGKELLSEKEGYIKQDSTEVISFNLNASEALFGGGARAIGMNRRGNRLQLYNKAHYGYSDRAELLNFTIPMVLSSKIYAVHFDNAPIGYLNLDSKKDNTLAYETISGRKTYQVIAGSTWNALIENYTLLTGRQPLPARWVLGNFASRFGYHSEKEARATVAKFRQEQIPLDAVIFDLYWFGKDIQGTLGNFEFLKDSFPGPEKMIADFKKDNVKTVLITEPFILTTSGKWQEAVDENILAVDKNGKPYTYDFYFGNTGIIDLFKPKAAEWFWDIYKKYTAMGVAGWWGDLGEPEMHPSFVQHATGSADEVHNIYGHNWAKLVFDGYAKDFPQQRPFILMRSGYSGSQRYGMIPWSGDVSRSWGGLKSQPEISLQMGMQGMGYMHSDLGGFAGDNLDDELYIKWLQYGVFQPIFRPHAQESVPAEPVYRTAEVKAMAKKAIELRYRMLPYNYTLAFENSINGIPLMRPVFFNEPENIKLFELSDEYLWGDAFLVAPVLQQGIIQRDVYFPKNNNWYSAATGQEFKGGTTAKVSINNNMIPYFYRGGAIIPVIDKNIQSTEEYTGSDITIDYIYDKSVKQSEALLYSDNGKTPNAYQKGEYEIVKFKSRLKSNKVEIYLTAETGKKYRPQQRQVTVVVNIPAGTGMQLKKETITWDSSKEGKITVNLK